MSTANKTVSSLREAVIRAVQAAQSEGLLPDAPMPDFIIETPADRSHGDLAVNAAMVSARAFRSAPRKIAEIIMQKLDLSGTGLERVPVS